MIGLGAITVLICLFRKSAIRASRFERIRFTIIMKARAAFCIRLRLRRTCSEQQKNSGCEF